MRSSTLLALALTSLPVAFAVACGGSAPPPSAPASGSSAPATTTASAKTISSPTLAAPVETAAPPPDDEAGGPCSYAHQKGTCEITAGGTFTFRGVVDGKSVTLAGNPLGEVDRSSKIGSSAPCTIDFMTEGTCTPCLFSNGGSCGQAAWEAFRAHK